MTASNKRRPARLPQPAPEATDTARPGPEVSNAATDLAAARILTAPNAITTIRLLCAPLFLWLLFGRSGGRYEAATLLAVLGTTDWVDGFLARRLGQVSTLGKVLDPAADRILLGVAVVGILIDGSVPLWLGIVVLARELLVAGAAIALAAAGAQRIDVQWVGKAGTFGLMIAFPLFLVAHSTAGWKDVAAVLDWCFAIPAVCFSWYAAITYVPLARRALADGRAGRKANVAMTQP